MIDLLSLDSLAACLLVGLGRVDRRVLVLLPLLCGLCDGLASAAHPLLLGAGLLSQARIPFALAWCAAWPVALLARPGAGGRGVAAILLLPLLLCLDNLADGGEAGPLAEGIGSLCCGLAGIVLARLWRTHGHQRLQALRR